MFLLFKSIFATGTKKIEDMPHFVIDCSENIINLKTPKEIIQKVYDTVGNTNSDFIHIFANIMEGRTKEQKSFLSRRIISELKLMFPDVTIISINIRDFEKATYCNKTMV